MKKIRTVAIEYGISDHVVFHEKVSDDKLVAEISQYTFGLVSHKRCLIMDYTLPNNGM